MKLRRFPTRECQRIASVGLGTIILVGLCHASPVQAAPSSPSELTNLSLEELMNVKVVSVTRQESTIRKSSAAIFVITNEMIRRSGAANIPELFRMVPGMNVARIDSNKWAISSRGFAERFFGKMLVQIDGRTLYSPVSAGVYWDTLHYPLQDIERIEVIRGPGASIWGANAVNGVINIVTYSANQTAGGRLQGGFGEKETTFGEARYSGKIGEDVFYRVYGTAFDRDEQFWSEGSASDDWHGGRGGLRADWGQESENAFTFDTSFFDTVSGRRDRRPQPTTPFIYTNIEDEVTSGGHVLGRWTHTIDEHSSWALRLYWDRFERHPDHLRFDQNWDTYDIDFHHRFKLGESHRLIYGLGYRLIDALIGSSASDNGFFIRPQKTDHNLQTYSMFVQDQIALIQDKLEWTIGSKIEHNDFTRLEVQPTSRLLWTPNTQHSAWLAVSRAVRTPNISEDSSIFRLLPASTASPVFPKVIGSADLDSEELLAYELGYRTQMADNFLIDAAFFFNDYKDLISSRPLTTQTDSDGTLFLPLVRDNLLNAETYGVELSAQWQVKPTWKLNSAYTFIEIFLHRETGLAATLEAPERQTPANQVYLQSSWDLPYNLQFDVMGGYIDGIGGFNPTGASGVRDDIDHYIKMDVRLGWKPTPNWEVEVVGQNLLDATHPEFGTSTSVQSPLIEIERSVYTRLTYQW